MTAPLWPLQAAIWDRLSGLPGFDLYAGVADRTSDGDHLVIGDNTGNPRGVLGRRGWEATETVHIWTRGDGSVMRAKQAVEAVRAALEDEPLEVAGHAVARCRLEFTTTLKEPGWWHVPARFRIHVMEVA
jgi:hypothetical protein